MKGRAIVVGLAGAGLAALVADSGWSRALALVALAGSLALLALSGTARRALGGLLAAIGLALVAIGVYAASADAAPKMLLVSLGGTAVAYSGWLVIRHSPAWTGMSSTYDRPTPTADPETSKDIWDALDRGEDPTTR
ncbi:hypothetical protein F4553_002703 [Allocatelliglobosispora scoriae]|uniref:Tryptophan-associated transmembrane protein n=1 Tax=Allocatelliglobosispora scoriae TaxID=643052 RepID=A0A841BM16_9ACTN|nr:Trp biosynthesis-associated membrane protein [Allocatelliglobosispora scoriae]MBB5869324.1 hypothetical protein [Allocatelliglobosispora scoriae]